MPDGKRVFSLKISVFSCHRIVIRQRRTVDRSTHPILVDFFPNIVSILLEPSADCLCPKIDRVVPNFAQSSVEYYCNRGSLLPRLVHIAEIMRIFSFALTELPVANSPISVHHARFALCPSPASLVKLRRIAATLCSTEQLQIDKLCQSTTNYDNAHPAVPNLLA